MTGPTASPGNPTPSPARHRAQPAPGPLDGAWQLQPSTAGVVLGTARDGTPVAAALLGPEPRRVGVVGGLPTGQLLAARLAGVGCELTVVTDRPAVWDGFRRWTPDPAVTVVDRVSRWPADGSRPPRALLVDMPDPPPFGLGQLPWTVVLHTTVTPPDTSPWWSAVDVLLIGAGGRLPDGGPVRDRLPAAARAAVANLARGEALLWTAADWGTFGVAPAPHESALIMPSASPAAP